MSNKNGLCSSTAVALTGADDSNLFVRVGRDGDVVIDGGLYVGGGASIAADLSVGETLDCREINVNEVTSYLTGVNLKVNGTAAGRFNSDGTQAILQGLTGTPCAVQVKCSTTVAADIRKDGSNNITFTVGGPAAPETDLKKQTATATYTYTPTLIKATSAIASGSTLSFTNTAEKLANASFTAPYTGYYQFIGQVRITSVGSFDVGTDSISFYADVAGGSLTPLIGSLNDICCVASGSDFEQTITGYVYATAGQTVDMYHIDVGVFTITGGTLFVMWKYLGAAGSLS